MSVLYVLVPVALLLAAGAVALFAWAARTGQLDDLDSPPLRMLSDDTSLPGDASAATKETRGPSGRP